MHRTPITAETFSNYWSLASEKLTIVRARNPNLFHSTFAKSVLICNCLSPKFGRNTIQNKPKNKLLSRACLTRKTALVCATWNLEFSDSTRLDEYYVTKCHKRELRRFDAFDSTCKKKSSFLWLMWNVLKTASLSQSNLSRQGQVDKREMVHWSNSWLTRLLKTCRKGNERMKSSKNNIKNTSGFFNACLTCCSDLK